MVSQEQPEWLEKLFVKDVFCKTARVIGIRNDETDLRQDDNYPYN